MASNFSGERLKNYNMTKMIKNSLCALFMLGISTSLYAQYGSDLKIEKILVTDTTSAGQTIAYPQAEHSEVTILKITLHPGQSTGWHKHGFPVFAYIQQGTLTVDLESGKSLEFGAQSSFAEVIDIYHNGQNKGAEDVVLVAFFMGDKGKALSTHR